MKQQTKRASLVGFGQFDLERVQLGEAFIAQQLETSDVAAVALAKQLQDVIAALVPGAR